MGRNCSATQPQNSTDPAKCETDNAFIATITFFVFDVNTFSLSSFYDKNTISKNERNPRAILYKTNE
jgi:hypothetical protein